MAPPGQDPPVQQEHEARDVHSTGHEANNPGSQDGANTGGRPRDTPDSSGHRDAGGRASGAGRGNLAPDRHRGQSSNAQAHSARHGINRSRAANNPGTFFGNLSARTETTMEIVRDLVDKSCGGDIERTFLANAKGEELRGLIRVPEHGERVIRLVQEKFDVDRVLIRVENFDGDRVLMRVAPYRPDQIATAQRTQTPLTVTSSGGRVRHFKSYQEYVASQDSQTTTGSERPKILCGSCDSPSHTLDICLASNETGVVKGCIFCNNCSHSTDGCAQFDELSLSDKVKVLVTERAGKPPLATVNSWWDYLLVWYRSSETLHEQPPTAFPWRQEFAARVNRGDLGKSVQDIQSEFDQHDSSVLPVDNKMQTLSDVFYRYWKGEETPVPPRAQAQIGQALLAQANELIAGTYQQSGR
ncbi:hypothetical protein ACHAP5_009401 [Fusarium lateritium]